MQINSKEFEWEKKRDKEILKERKKERVCVREPHTHTKREIDR